MPANATNNKLRFCRDRDDDRASAAAAVGLFSPETVAASGYSSRYDRFVPHVSGEKTITR
jgi:hypothetical protein